MHKCKVIWLWLWQSVERTGKTELVFSLLYASTRLSKHNIAALASLLFEDLHPGWLALFYMTIAYIPHM